jgi:hypothetical protein
MAVSGWLRVGGRWWDGSRVRCWVGAIVLRGMTDNIGKLYCKVDGIEVPGICLLNRNRLENIKF